MSRNPAYDHDEDTYSGPLQQPSHKQQIDQLQNGFTVEQKQLEDQFPIRNHILFPDKRVYTKNGLFWDLTSLRLDVWAAAIPHGRAMLNDPPMSNLFTKTQTVKPRRPDPNATPEIHAAYTCHTQGRDYVAPPAQQNPAAPAPAAPMMCMAL
ncbi:hypothetical protein L210DRAFT_3651662 [Boletus edulis BED1]|uniref:Uncharacterized protein n=1 Tax=Boletus edulis BED1 TaxID=1328754 RepID=A0AAD4BGZ1_BOLED|nr:hypothetical protein L210DRAFT_3651662 [Boletus edulis BED1]